MTQIYRIDDSDTAAEQTQAQLRYDGAAFAEFGLSGDDLAAFFGDCMLAADAGQH